MTSLTRPMGAVSNDAHWTQAHRTHLIDFPTCVWVTADKIALPDAPFPTVYNLLTSSAPPMFVAHNEEPIWLFQGGSIEIAHRPKNRLSFFEGRLVELRRMSAAELLRSVVQRHGMSWVDLARTLEVSVPAIRKWRTSGRPSAQNQAALAQLHAMLDAIQNEGVADPARWFAEPLLDGFTVTARDLYDVSNASEIVSVAAGEGSTQDLLDAYMPGWRQAHATRFSVVRDLHGQNTIVASE